MPAGIRASRPNNAPTVLLQGTVSPEARNAVSVAAKASSVSNAYYVDTIIHSLLAAGGLPLVGQLSRPKSQQLALELTAPPADEPSTVPFQVRVSPEARDAFDAAALASGVRKKRYLNAFILSLVDDHGALPLVDDPRQNKVEELSIPAA